MFGASAPAAAAGGAAATEVEGLEVDAPWLTLKKPTLDVAARLFPPVDLAGLPAHCQLLDVLNERGVFVAAGGSTELGVYQLERLEQQLTAARKGVEVQLEADKMVEVGEPLVWLRFTSNGATLVTSSTSATIRLFSVDSLLGPAASPAQPSHVFPALPSPLTLLLPNPSALPSSVLLLSANSLAVIDVASRGEVFSLPGAFTAASWSAKGKQIAVGSASGEIAFVSPTGAPVSSPIPVPASIAAEGPYEVCHLSWLENDLFLASYNTPTEPGADEPSHEVETFLIGRVKTTSGSVEYTFTRFADPLPAYGLRERAEARHAAWLGAWGGKKHLGFLGTASSPVVGAFSAGPPFALLTLEEASAPSLPLTAGGDDVSLLGMVLDLRSTQPLKRGLEGGEELPDLPPAPKLLALTSEGVVAAWEIWNTDAGAYEGMVRVGASAAAPPAASPSTAPFSAQPPTAFGFGAPSAVGSSSAFGAPSAFGKASPPSGSQTAAPSTSPFGASSTPGASSAFGSSPTFGASSAFGASAPKAGASAFGSAAAPPAFGGGMPAFGPGASKPAGGAFGAPSAFGQSAAASPGASSSAFGSSTSAFGAPSAFGTQAKPAPSAFGAPPAASTPPASGSSAFGATSAFGAAATPAFGASSISGTKIAPIAAPAAGGFGNFSAGPSKGGFAGFAGFGPQAKKNNAGGVFGSNSPTTTPSKPPAASAFGGSPSAFGAGASSAFGSSTSAFGSSPSSAFGSTSAFGSASSAFGSSAPYGSSSPKATAGPSAAPTTSAFGVPASAFGATSAFGAAAKSSTPPDSAPFVPMGHPSPTEAKVVELSSVSTPPGSPRSGSDSPSSRGNSPPRSPSGSSDEESNPSRSASPSPSPPGSPSNLAPAKPPALSSQPAADIDLGSLGFGSTTSADPTPEAAQPSLTSIEDTGAVTIAQQVPEAEPSPAVTKRLEEAPVEPEADVKEPSTPPPANKPANTTVTPTHLSTSESPIAAKKDGFSGFGNVLGSTLDEQQTPEADSSDAAATTETKADAWPPKDASSASTPPSSPAKPADASVPTELATTAPTASLFGGKRDTTPAASAAPSPTSSAFGQPAAFGSAKSSGPSTFGTAPAQAATSTFGGVASLTGSPAASSAFGAASIFGKPSISGPKISPTATPAGGVFAGFSASGGQGGFGGFGSAAKSPAASDGGTSIFGGEAKTAAPAFSGFGGFGQQPPASREDTAPVKGAVTASAPALKPTATSAFGSTGSAFGSAPKVSSPLASPAAEESAPTKAFAGFGAGFGAGQGKSPIGEPSTTPVKPPPTSSPFEAPLSGNPAPIKTPLFGESVPSALAPIAGASTAKKADAPASEPAPMTATPSEFKPAFAFPAAPSSLFGPKTGDSKPVASPFGVAAAPSLFASPAGKSPFGAPASSPFGAPPTSSQFGPQSSAKTVSLGETEKAGGSTKPSLFGLGSPPVKPEAAAAGPFSSTPVVKPSALGLGKPPSFASTPPGSTPAKPSALPITSSPAPPPGASGGGGPLKAFGSTPSDPPSSKPTRKAAEAVDIGGLSGQFLRAYLATNEEIEDLKETATNHSLFLKDAGTPHAVKGDLDAATSVSLGDLAALSRQIKAKETSAAKAKDEGLQLRKRILEVQSLMLQADTKAEEAARFIGARHDPKVIELMRSRQLGPEAAETQQRLRAQQKQVSERIEQLEEQMQVLHKLVLSAKRGSQPLKAPTLDTISRSIRHITMALNQRTYEIDDLSLRFDMAQLSSSLPRRRLQAPAIQQFSSAVTDAPAPPTRSPLRAALARPVVQEQVAALAARALNEERNLSQARSIIQDARQTPIVTTVLPRRVPRPVLDLSDPLAPTAVGSAADTLSDSGSLLATPRKFVPVERTAAPAQSPLTMGSLATPPSKFGGLPSHFGGPPPSGASQKVPTSRLAQPPLNFSSFGSPPPPTTFSTLDASAFELNSPGDSHDSGGGSRRREKPSSHTSAPKFVAPKQAVKTPATSSSFSFGPPPPLPKSTFAQPSAGSGFSFAAAPSSTPAANKLAAPTFTGFTDFGAAPSVSKAEKVAQPTAAGDDEDEDEDELEEGEDEDEEDSEDDRHAYDWTGKGGDDDGGEDEEEASEEDYEG